MVGYVCKDSGKSHYKTFRKNISKAEANIALTGYRVRQRQLVKDNRVELGKKNFWSILMRFKQVLSDTTSYRRMCVVRAMVCTGVHFIFCCIFYASPCVDLLRARANDVCVSVRSLDCCVLYSGLVVLII